MRSQQIVWMLFCSVVVVDVVVAVAVVAVFVDVFFVVVVPNVDVVV